MLPVEDLLSVSRAFGKGSTCLIRGQERSGPSQAGRFASLACSSSVPLIPGPIKATDEIQERVQAAGSEAHKRRLVLSQECDGTPEEREALVNAISGPKVLQMNAAPRLEPQTLSGTPKAV